MENDTTPNYFIQVPLDLLKDYDLTPTDYLVFGQIYTMLNVTQKCFLSNANMGDKLGIKPNTVQKSISKMKKLGLIETNLIYKDGSKEVDKRFITLTPHGVYHHPHGRESTTPRDDNPGGHGRESTDNRLFNRLDEYIEEEEEQPINGAFQSYEELWGFPNAVARQDLLDWINDYSDEVVNYAIKIAGRNNVQSKGAFNYVDRVLTNWKQSGVTDLESAKKATVERQQRVEREYKSRRTYNKPVKREELPDWQSERDNAKPADEDKKKALQERIKKMEEGHKK